MIVCLPKAKIKARLYKADEEREANEERERLQSELGNVELDPTRAVHAACAEDYATTQKAAPEGAAFSFQQERQRCGGAGGNRTPVQR